MPYFHCSSVLLAAGSVIEPGNWGRIIRNFGWGHNQSGRETTLEHIRQASFPGKPSRFDCAFFFDDENEARFYVSSDGFRAATLIAYEIELLDDKPPQHLGDWRNINPTGSLDLGWASRYWQGQMLAPLQNDTGTVQCREVLAVTAMRIMRRLP